MLVFGLRCAVVVGCGVLMGTSLGCASKTTPEPAAQPPSSADAPADAPVAAATVPGSEGPALAEAPASARPPGTIYRSELDRALARGPGYLLYELGPEPYRLSGKFVGWEITRVFPDEPGLCAEGCDLLVGDIILSVNGDRLETPQAFSNLIEALPQLDTLVIKSLRDEKRRVATYTLRAG